MTAPGPSRVTLQCSLRPRGDRGEKGEGGREPFLEPEFVMGVRTWHIASNTLLCRGRVSYQNLATLYNKDMGRRRATPDEIVTEPELVESAIQLSSVNDQRPQHNLIAWPSFSSFEGSVRTCCVRPPTARVRACSKRTLIPNGSSAHSVPTQATMPSRSAFSNARKTAAWRPSVRTRS